MVDYCWHNKRPLHLDGCSCFICNDVFTNLQKIVLVNDAASVFCWMTHFSLSLERTFAAQNIVDGRMGTVNCALVQTAMKSWMIMATDMRGANVETLCFTARLRVFSVRFVYCSLQFSVGSYFSTVERVWATDHGFDAYENFDKTWKEKQHEKKIWRIRSRERKRGQEKERKIEVILWNDCDLW